MGWGAVVVSKGAGVGAGGRGFWFKGDRGWGRGRGRGSVFGRVGLGVVCKGRSGLAQGSGSPQGPNLTVCQGPLHSKLI